MLTHRKSRGIAIVAVLISAVVFLGIIIAITGTLSLSSRQSTGDQRVTLEAQYASESGISRVNAEAQTGLMRTWSQLLFRMDTGFSMQTNTIQQMAARFCNLTALPATPATPVGAGNTVQYCPATTGANVANRYSVFSQLIPVAAYNPTQVAPAVPVSPPVAGAVPTNVATAETYWTDVFSDGSNGIRYSSVIASGIRYDANFGLQAIDVRIDNTGAYVFQFKVRDSTSTGRYTSAGKEIATRATTRAFPGIYRITLTPPNLSAFLSLTNQQTVNNGLGNQVNVVLNSNSFFDGPIHTNGAFNYVGNPWMSNTVTSAGCVNGFDPVTSTCTGATATAFQGNGTQIALESGTNYAQFDGYTTAPAANATNPDFVWQNLTPTAATPYAASGNATKPWGYSGKYDAGVVRLPVTNTDVRADAISSGIYFGPSLEVNGSGVPIVPHVAVDPAIGGYYYDVDSMTPGVQTARVFLRATDTPITDRTTTMSDVPNNGTAATGQFIRIKTTQKISRCPAVPTGIAINPLLPPAINTGSSKAFTAIVTGPTTPTYDAAAVDPAVTWEVVTLPAGVTGSLAGSGTNSLTGTFQSTAGATPPGEYVFLRARHASGILSDSARLAISGVPASGVNIFGGGNVPYMQPSATKDVTWTAAAGTPVIGYELLSSNTNFGASTATAVTGTSYSVPVDTSVKGKVVYYKIRATGPTLPAFTTTGVASTTVIASNPTVTKPVNFTSTNSNYQSASRILPYTGGNISFDFSVSNTTATNPTSGVGNGPFTYEVQFQINGGGWSTASVMAPYVSGNTITNFPIKRNTSTGDESYRFRARAKATATNMQGSYGSVSDALTVSKIVDPTTTLNPPIPNSPLPFGGASVTLTWATPTALNTPGPFTFQIQESVGGAPFTNLGGTLNNAFSTTVTPTVTTKYQVLTTDQTIQAIPLVRGPFPSNEQTVTVLPLDLPTIVDFWPTNNPVAAGGQTPLNWNVRNAATINVERIYPTTVPLRNTSHTPNGTTINGSVSSGPISLGYADFRLTATNVVGAVTRIIRVYAGTVGPGLPTPPINVTLTANPTQVYYPNTSSALTWAATNATSGTITQTVGGVTTAIAGGAVAASGDTRGVTLTNTTTYTFTSSNAGGSVVRNVLVTVNPPAEPLVTITAVNPSPVSGQPSSQFSYQGGTANISWSVDNKTAPVNGPSGAGAGPYNYKVYESVNGVENSTPIYNNSGTSTTAPQAVNNSTADVTRSYRIVATNTTTSLIGYKTSSNLVTLTTQLPTVVLNNPTPAIRDYPGGSTALTSGAVNNTALAGTGPYTYRLKYESVYNSGVFDTQIYSGSTPPSSVANTITNSGNTALVRRYRVEVTNTATSLTGFSNIVEAKVNAPLPPQISTMTMTPSTIIARAGGSSVLAWKVSIDPSRPITSMKLNGPGASNVNIPVVNGQVNYSANINIASPNFGTNNYTVTATGLGGTDDESKALIYTPPEVVLGLNPNGAPIEHLENATPVLITPSSFSATPQWSSNRGGVRPSFDKNDFTVTVFPSSEAVTATISDSGQISVSVGDLPAGRGDEFPYKVRVQFSKNGDTVPATPLEFIVKVVKRSGFSSSIRPRARLTQTCTYGTAQEYAWPVFLEYYLLVDPGNPSNVLQYSRTYGSTVFGSWTPPADAPNDWELVATKPNFNGVIYLDGGLSVEGPARTTLTDPNTAPPAVANFARLTTASDGQITVLSDLKYEDPVCRAAPFRRGDGLVQPADCNRDPLTNPWSRNVLGLYTTSTNGIKINTTAQNTTIQAISLASQGVIEVAGVPQTPTNLSCPNALNTTTNPNLGSINIQGGLIQQRFGEFGRLSGNTITCGYGRTMTYDIRMQDPSFQPPSFPPADNQRWPIAFFGPNSLTPVNTAVPNPVLPAPVGFTGSK